MTSENSTGRVTGAAAFDQAAAEFAFEFGELLGQGRRGEGEPLGGGRDRSGVCDLHQDPYPIGVQHPSLPGVPPIRTHDKV